VLDSLSTTDGFNFIAERGLDGAIQTRFDIQAIRTAEAVDSFRAELCESSSEPRAAGEKGEKTFAAFSQALSA